MKPGVKLAAFTLVLAAAFGGGTALGATFAPEPEPAPMDHSNMPGMDHSQQPPAPTTAP